MNHVVSMAELSRELDINKSKLAYYVTKGLLVPAFKASTTYLFDRREAKRVLGIIERMQDKGKSLEEIKRKLDKK